MLKTLFITIPRQSKIFAFLSLPVESPAIASSIILAPKAGADIVATTLSGYTQYTVKTPGPDLDLIKDLCDKVNVPVIAEGRFMTPEDVDKGLAAGAHSVVIGKMITNAMFITSQFIAQSERIAK